MGNWGIKIFVITKNLALPQQISKPLQNPNHFSKQISIPKIPTKLTLLQMQSKFTRRNPINIGMIFPARKLILYNFFPSLFKIPKTGCPCFLPPSSRQLVSNF